MTDDRGPEGRDAAQPEREDRRPWWAGRRDGNFSLPAATGAGARRGFGTTWWGRAWLEALEQRARLDPNRLGRGKSYARRGSVLEHSLEPGVVTAVVQGSRRDPYAVTVRTNVFSDADWEAVLDMIAAQVGRVAALLDGELPPEVVDDARAAGLELLPSVGDVRLNCNCPDFANPCKHAAAVCYLVADALDADPFALLLLRGRSRADLLAALRSRRTASAPVSATVERRPPGVPAKAAFARTDRPPVPRPPLPPTRPGVPAAVLALEPPPGIEGLTALASDAARRAWDLAAGDGDGGLALTRDEDLARHAARVLGTPDLAAIAHAAGVPARTLTSWAIAWREAGAPGLTAARDTFDPGAEAMAEARTALERTAPGVPVVVQGNKATAGRTQLRLGPDNLWYLFTLQFNDWTLTAPPSPDPTDLLAH